MEEDGARQTTRCYDTQSSFPDDSITNNIKNTQTPTNQPQLHNGRETSSMMMSVRHNEHWSRDLAITNSVRRKREVERKKKKKKKKKKKTHIESNLKACSRRRRWSCANTEVHFGKL
jgi:hypothetical protein